MQIYLLVLIAVLLEQHIQLTDGVTCASNPCNLVPGIYDVARGYCCYDIPPNDSVCTCPNNVPSVLNGPCRIATTTTTVGQAFCNRTCVNGGVCNIVSNQQVCWCTLGYSGSFCEIQGTPTRCSTGVCQVGTCVEETLGSTVYAYCHCNPGWTGTRCDLCYFTCTQVGVFPDTAYCAIGRYYYCPQASGAPVIALCPDGQKFNRTTNVCDTFSNCT